MNCDGYVCEADLFSFMKNLKDDEFFRKIMLQDITDIQRTLLKKKEELLRNDPVFDYSGPNPKIKDTNGYIAASKQRTMNVENLVMRILQPGKEI